MTHATPGTPMVRALFRSVAVAGPSGAPTLFTKVHYPATYGGTHEERNTGLIPPTPRDTPYPIALMMPGVNVGPGAYDWLATALVESGFVAVTYGWIVEEMPGMIALSPGLDVSALKPDAFSLRPSATALTALIADLDAQNHRGPLAGLLDTGSLLLGGHSAGGSVALFNANPEWFPGVKAAFAYGAHAKASTMLGWPEGTVLSLPNAVPMLVLGGSEDGVIAASAFRYGKSGDQAPDPTGPLLRTFREGIRRDQGDCHLAIVKGANHFSCCWPADPAAGRPFLDAPTTRSDEAIRADLIALVSGFARAYVANDPRGGKDLQAVMADPSRVSLSESR